MKAPADDWWLACPDRLVEGPGDYWCDEKCARHRRAKTKEERAAWANRACYPDGWAAGACPRATELAETCPLCGENLLAIDGERIEECVRC